MNNNRGATLVELMIAMLVIMIVSLGFFNWLGTVMRMNTSIERSNTAYAMANDVADRLQRMNDNSLIQHNTNRKCVGYVTASADLRGCSDTGVNPPPNCNTGGTPQVPLSSGTAGPTILTNPTQSNATPYLFDNNTCEGVTWATAACRTGSTITSGANASIDHPNATLLGINAAAYDSINPIRSYKGATYYAVWSVAYLPCATTGTGRRKIFITVYWFDPEPGATIAGSIIKSVSLVADKTIGAET